MKNTCQLLGILLLLVLVTCSLPTGFDRIDGPIVADARISIARNDITPVLKWIGKAGDAALKPVLESTLCLRQMGGAEEERADRPFFGTLIPLDSTSGDCSGFIVV